MLINIFLYGYNEVIKKYNIYYGSFFLFCWLIGTIAKADESKALELRSINALTQTRIKGVTNWKIINESTNKIIVVSSRGQNNSYVNIGSKTEESKISKGKWWIVGVSGDYTGVKVIEVDGSKDLSIDVNMYYRVSKVRIFAKSEATIGTILPITWEAPDTMKGKINLQEIEKPPNFYAPPNIYTMNRVEQRANIRLPSKVGEYMIRFYNVSDHEEPLAEHGLILKQANIKIIAPKEAIAGTEIEISWIAPDTSQGKINFKHVNDKKMYNALHFIYTKNKTKAKFLLPSQAGDYVLRWYNVFDRQPILEYFIRINKQSVKMSAPSIAQPNKMINVSWEAPINSEAIITLTNENQKKKILAMVYTRGKREAIIRLPNVEGDYVLTWKNISDNYSVATCHIKVYDR